MQHPENVHASRTITGCPLLPFGGLDIYPVQGDMIPKMRTWRSILGKWVETVMALSRKQTWLASFFLVMATVSIVMVVYRAFTVDWEKRSSEYRQQAEAALPPSQSVILPDRVVLLKDQAVTIDRTRLVYKGLQDGLIHLHLGLLDLDPQYNYPKTISPSATETTIQLGGRRYRLAKVNRSTLTLTYAN
jgi:hypothetical protein